MHIAYSVYAMYMRMQCLCITYNIDHCNDNYLVGYNYCKHFAIYQLMIIYDRIGVSDKFFGQTYNMFAYVFQLLYNIVINFWPLIYRFF